MFALVFLKLFILKLFLELFLGRGVGNREVVVAALEAAREAFVEHDEFGTIGTGSGILGPIRGNLPREAGVAGEDQDGRAMDAHGRFLALQVGPRGSRWLAAAREITLRFRRQILQRRRWRPADSCSPR